MGTWSGPANQEKHQKRTKKGPEIEQKTLWFSLVRPPQKKNPPKNVKKWPQKPYKTPFSPLKMTLQTLSQGFFKEKGPPNVIPTWKPSKNRPKWTCCKVTKRKLNKTTCMVQTPLWIRDNAFRSKKWPTRQNEGTKKTCHFSSKNGPVSLLVTKRVPKVPIPA